MINNEIKDYPYSLLTSFDESFLNITLSRLNDLSYL